MKLKRESKTCRSRGGSQSVLSAIEKKKQIKPFCILPRGEIIFTTVSSQHLKMVKRHTLMGGRKRAVKAVIDT